MLSRTLPRLLSQRTLSRAESAILLSTARTTAQSTRHASSKRSSYTPHPYLCRRALSTPPPHVNHSDLPMDRYHALADTTMISLLERLEHLLDEVANEGFEVDYHSGVLTLNLGSHGTYVINKQPPNKQIWLSSPVRFVRVPTVTDHRVLTFHFCEPLAPSQRCSMTM
ncbi:hypothetical protein V8E55_000894 [Tylopilus felleus]